MSSFAYRFVGCDALLAAADFDIEQFRGSRCGQGTSSRAQEGGSWRCWIQEVRDYWGAGASLAIRRGLEGTRGPQLRPKLQHLSSRSGTNSRYRRVVAVRPAVLSPLSRDE